MNISNETLKALNSAMQNNPKHSPTGHWCDYYRWIEFIICSYKNNDYIESWDLYEYLMENGYKNFEYEAEQLMNKYYIIADFIHHLRMSNGKYENINWLVDKIN